MISSFLLLVAAMGVALPPTEACTYWCRNPDTRGYDCCDEGNPWHTGEVEEPVDAEVEAVEIETHLGDVDNTGSSGCVYYCLYNGRNYCCDYGENTREVEEPVDAEVEAVEIEFPLGDVDNSGSSGCVYYCLYNGRNYCCDNGENPLPADHEDNAGRCPTEEEQSCKVSAADKKPTGKVKNMKNKRFYNNRNIRNRLRNTTISRVFVDKLDNMCASDGYCAEEQKCCPNKCHKKYTCMPSF